MLSYFKDQNIIPEYRWRAVRRRLLPPAKEATIDKAGAHEEWKRILYDVRGRSLYLFLLSIGARIGETLKLKIADLELDADPLMAHIRPE